MRVLILNQFFYPDISATSQLMTDLAEDLQGAGIEITALAGRETYFGGGDLKAREDYRGIQIRRVRCLRFERGSGVRRILSYLSFHASAFVALLVGPAQDFTIALTTPPLIATTALLAGKLRRTKVICLVQDLYPEVAVELSALRRRSWITKLLAAVAHRTMRSSDAVIVLGACMRARVLDAGVPARKLEVITNWMDSATVRPIAGENRFASEHGLADKFVVLYSGNMGRAHDLDTILDAAQRLRDCQDIVFVFIGDGPQRSNIERSIANRNLKDVKLLPYLPRERLAESLTLPGAGLISQAPGLAGLIVPSKLYGLMAAGQPCLFIGPADTEAARTVQRFDCGFVIANGDGEALANAILLLRDQPSLRAAMGARARIAFEQNFDRRIVTDQYRKLLVKLGRT